MADDDYIYPPDDNEYGYDPYDQGGDDGQGDTNMFEDMFNNAISNFD